MTLVDYKLSRVGVDPIESAEIMELMGGSYIDLNDPKRNRKIQDIVGYFQGKTNKRTQILKIISGKSGNDKLDILWTYVELKKEQERRISNLSPNDFEKDIAAEIVSGFVSNGSLSKLRKDFNDIENEKKKMAHEQFKTEEREEKNRTRLIIKTMDSEKLKRIKEETEELAYLNKQLEAY